jgi:hypothetical protein
MTPLELELSELAPFVELPPEPDLGPAVRARVAAAPAPRRLGRRPTLVLALALVLLGLAIALAVPPARSAILRWLGIGTARIELVDRLPDVARLRPLDLGPRSSLADAQSRVAYHVVTSPLLGAPQEVHLRGDQVGFVYGRKLVVTQSRGTFFTKEAGPGTRVEQLRVNDRLAVWISGAPHFLGYIGLSGQPTPITLYLAGNALIWQRGPLTLRLEGKLTRAEALRIARSFR